MHVWINVHMHQSTCLEVRGQLAKVQPCRLRIMGSGRQAWSQTHLPSEPSLLPRNCVLNSCSLFIRRQKYRRNLERQSQGGVHPLEWLKQKWYSPMFADRKLTCNTLQRPEVLEQGCIFSIPHGQPLSLYPAEKPGSKWPLALGRSFLQCLCILWDSVLASNRDIISMA